MGPAIRTPDQRLRVFVSSTLGELADERRAVRAAIEQLRLTPVMFELGARPHPPRALYRSYLAQSDVFVGIYWQRYGWIGPGMEISGLEDELLLSAGMPRLLYVKRPAPNLEPRLGEMLTRVQDEDTASYKPFGTADELRDLLIDDLAILLAERFDGGRESPFTSASPRNNLPTPTSTFLGREVEVRHVRGLVAEHDVRLITLTGPAGTGKTRLAISVVAQEVDRFADGVCFVDLSAERAPEEAFAAVARALGVVVPTDARPLDVLEAELREREICLVLDNLEQVVAAGVATVELLEHCPDLTVLVTSREALHVRGEHVFLVPPLALPDPRDATTAADSEAVRLFGERAAAVRPGFVVDDGNLADVVAVCRRLDGLPLAIELAAARIQLFDPSDLRSRLDDRFDVLRGGARDLPKRQQTLRDAIMWSYDLLSPDERQGLGLFALFSGARLADIEATAARVEALSDVDVIEVFGSLVDKSLVQSTEGYDGRPRFSMLQTIRGYALEQLETMPDLAPAARRAHAEHYTALASRVNQQLALVGRPLVLSALSDELSNLRAAWDEWVALGDVARLNDLLSPLWGYYDARGDYRSAMELGKDLLECLALTRDSPDRRRHEFVVHMNLVRTEIAVRGFSTEAEEIIGGALARAAADQDGRQRFPGLRSLAYLHLMRTDYERMEEIACELMDIAEREHDQLLLSEAHLLAGLSRASLGSDFPAALRHYDQAVQHSDATHSGYVDFRVGPNPGVVANVVSALTRWMVGQPDTAAITMQRALEQAVNLDHPYSIAYALHHAGLLDLWRLDLTSVAERADALLAIAEAHDYPTWRALALVLGGVAVVGSGDVDAGLAQVEQGFEIYKGLSTPLVFWPALLAVRAEALRMAGRSAEGLALIDEAIAAIRPGDTMVVEVTIVRGDLLLGLSPPELASAEAVFERVAALASDRGARMAQVRALTRLADLRRGTPAEHDAVRALREVYDSFVEGFDAPQLVAARAALDGTVVA